MARVTPPTPHAITAHIAACLIALTLLLQAIVLPLSFARAAPLPAAPACDIAPQHSCCDQGSCCCGDPDICLCVAECPDTPMTPTRDSDPARPTEHRADLAIPARSDAIATPMPFTPRNRAVVSSAPRPISAVRTQAILSIWLT